MTEATAHIGLDTYKTALLARNHTAIADEKTENGGTNLGPAPFELLLESLGACTAITLRMYANRKQWALASVNVALTLEQANSSTSTIQRTIQLTGDLTDEQRTRLMEIANLCPVHKLLSGTIAIHSTLTI